MFRRLVAVYFNHPVIFSNQTSSAISLKNLVQLQCTYIFSLKQNYFFLSEYRTFLSNRITCIHNLLAFTLLFITSHTYIYIYIYIHRVGQNDLTLYKRFHNKSAMLACPIRIGNLKRNKTKWHLMYNWKIKPLFSLFILICFYLTNKCVR